ncbi:MAG: HEAT repeat domain-containing protein, partial [Persicimonas sp.]
ELRENHAGYAGAAAEALGESGVERGAEDMAELYESTDDYEIKEGILRGFTHIPDPVIVPALSETLRLDVDNNPIALHSYSCDILGDVALDHPDAIDEDAREAIVLGLYQSNNKGQSTGKECGLAVQKVGEPMVDLLIETYEGENEEVNELIRKFNQPPRYEFPANYVKIAAAGALGALRAEEAVEPMLDDLRSEKAANPQMGKHHATQWRTKEGQATSETINALGNIGDEEAVDTLSGIVEKRYIEDEWSDFVDALVELQLRQNAADALVRIGDRGATDMLINMAENGSVAELERRAKALEKADEDPMDDEERYQLNWRMAKAFANLAGANDASKLQGLIDRTQQEGLKEKYEQYLPKVEKGGECLGKSGDEAQAECFGDLLSDDEASSEVYQKAAFELSRLSADAAGPVVEEHLGHDNLSAREIVTFAAYRVPTEGMVDKVDEVLKDEENRSSDEYKMDHRRLKHLKAWLQNHNEADAEE